MPIVTEQEGTVRIPASEYEALKSAVQKLERENKRLSDEIVILLNRFLRKKSERLDPNQLRLFLEELSTIEAVEEPVEEVARESRERRKGHGRAPFAPHLPREVIELDLPEADRICPRCGKAMTLLGIDACERGHVVPAKMLVRRYERKKYGCPEGHAVRTADLPPTVIDKGKYEPSVYAHLAVAKYGDHLPLHRLEGIYKRSGFHLPRSTMWEMVSRTGEIAAEPILRQMRKELLAEPILHGDETPTTVRLEDRKGSRKAYTWCYGIGRKWVFDFTMTRERDGPLRFLGDWAGTLLADGYSGFDEVVRRNGIRRGGCWAHARRKVKEALDTGACQAVPLMREIGRLFSIERAIRRRARTRDLEKQAYLELRAEVRARRSRSVLDRIRALVHELWEERSTLPKSLLGKALTYLDNQWEPLSLFLEVPGLEIHNNDCERALRHLVVGKKNWLFFGSERGGRIGASLFSLIATCKALGVHPERYLEDVLVRVDTLPASEIARLTPWAWAQENGGPQN